MTKNFSIDSYDAQSNQAFAIVGIGCRLPGGVTNASSYWQLMKDKRTGIRVIPEDRWGVDMFYDSDQNMVGRSVSKWAGFIDGVREFDPGFFGLSPREAAAMDPQQRLVLQTAYEAMEDAGIPSDTLSKARTGVFVGIQSSDYREVQQQRRSGAFAYGGTSLALCIVANRVSHRLDLKGPSYAVDTACSSSLTALNQALLNMRLGQCDHAIVSGVNLLLSPATFLAFSKAGMLSPTGVLSTFDAKANGFVRGEGVGTVVVKPLDHAVADGNRIYAVIEGSKANQDGFTSTITAPNQDAQIEMLRGLLGENEVTPDMIGYVEAHGTGTPIGDPIEAGAIGRVIGQSKTNGSLPVGSVKPNIGHLESGAGVNGLIKVALAIHNGEIPPNINFERANPLIPLDALNIHIPTETIPFQDYQGVRRGVVNSFGFGGANACALLRSAPERPVEGIYRIPAKADKTREPRMVPISAKNEKSLQALANKLSVSLREGGALSSETLENIAASLGNSRTHHQHRAVVIARDKQELMAGLKFLASNETDQEQPNNVVRGQVDPARKICFMFAGQGSQWWGMARDLLQNNAVFEKSVDAYDAEFMKASGWSIKKELLRDEVSSRIDDTTVTQPALFAIQSGLCAVWKSWGVTPDMVTGHSIGEAAAAHIAGGLTLKGAARFLSKRGAIRDKLGAKGAMAAIGLDVEEVRSLLPGHGLINIAAINGPASTTISGDYTAVHEFVTEFSTNNPNTLARILRVDTAWHSYQLEAGEEWFRDEVSQIDWSVPRIPFISTVTGQPETKFDVDYGWLNLRRPVNFQGGVECALKLGATVFVEIGPHTTLSGPATASAANMGVKVDVVSSLNRKQDDSMSMAVAAARLFVGGTSLNWLALNGHPSHHVKLPSYPWQNDEFWMASEEWNLHAFTSQRGALLGMRENGAKDTWTTEINLTSYPYIGDHRLQSECVFPGTGYMEIIFEAARDMFGDGVIEVEHLRIHEALFIPSEADVRFWTEYVSERNQIKIYTQVRDTGEDWVLRAEAVVRKNDIAPCRIAPLRKDSKGCEEFSRELIYKATSDDGVINYGVAFQTVRELWANKSRTGARVSMTPGFAHGFEKYEAHPALLDACLQISDPRMSRETLRTEHQDMTEAFMPIGAIQMRLYRPLPAEFLVYSRQRPRLDPVTAQSDFVITDLDDNVIFEMNGLLNRSLHGKSTKVHADGFVPHFVTEDYIEYREPSGSDIAEEAGHWLVFAEDKKQPQDVIAELEKRGSAVTCVSRDDVTEAEMTDDIADILTNAVDQGNLKGVLYLWNLSADPIDKDCTAAKVSETVIQETKSLIALGAALDEIRNAATPPRLIMVTRNAHVVSSYESAALDSLSQMPLAAALRTIANESPEFSIKQIDVDEAVLNAPKRLVDAILTDTNETEIVLRKTKAFVPRLNRIWSAEMPPQELIVQPDDDDTNFCVTMETPGVIDNLQVVECPLDPVGPNEVRVKVAAVGLNFRDIMAVTGLLPREAEGEPAWRNLGLEFGGTVVSIGQDVKNLKPGDRVMGLGKRCLQRFLTVNQGVLAKVPDHISLEEASTIPSAFATAHYALNRVGRLSRGERVLIHVATGGVGTAAVQMAKNVGAEIFATAGSPAKRKLLKSQGIKHVMNSRDLSFADEIMRKTEGRGVDVVLNSLPGAYIEKGIDILAPYGRFLEIGKRDVYEDNSIGMKALRRNVSLSVLDLAAMGVERPDLLGEMFHEINESFIKHDLEPLPFERFPVNQVSDAVRFMSQARHVGKVVVTFDQPEFMIKARQDRKVTFERNAAYLITGGNGGFGLSLATWMANAGAGKLILASRSGKVPEAEQHRLQQIKDAGAKVDVVSLDITSQNDTERFIGKCFKDKKYPLKGVLHAAAVLKDGFVTQLTDDMIADVINPKVAGAWSLHRAFEKAGQQPEFMIGFSSIASTTGAAGQSNYVAANGFLDALAVYRKNQGDLGGAINWGAIADTGMVGRNEDLRKYLESIGLKGLEEGETAAGIESLLKTALPSFTYANADWQQMARTNAQLARIPRISGMLKKRDEKSSEVRNRLLQLEGDALVDEIEHFVKGEIGGVLKIDPDQIDPTTPTNNLGLDSLSSFELKMRIETALGMNLQVARFLQANTLIDLVGILAEEIERMKIEVVSEVAAETAAGETGTGSRAASSDFVLSDRGMGLLRASVAAMTSSTAREAFENRLAVKISPAFDDKMLTKAIKSIAKRHKLLCCRLTDKLKTAKVVFDSGMEENRVSVGIDNVEIVPLDPAVGVSRVSWSQTANDSTELVLQIHKGVCDAQGAEIVLADLLRMTEGQKLGRAASKSKLRKEMQSRVYDPDNTQAQSDRAFWHYALGDSAPAIDFPHRARALLPDVLGRNHGVPLELSASFHASNADETDFVLAMSTALAKVCGHQSNILLTRYVRRQGKLISVPLVGPFDAEQPVYVPMDKHISARRQFVSTVLKHAEEHDALDLHTLCHELSDQFSKMKASPFQIAYQFQSGEDDQSFSTCNLPEACKNFVVKPMKIANSGLAHDIFFQATVTKTNLDVVMRIDSEVVCADQANAIMSEMGENLVYADKAVQNQIELGETGQ